MLPAGFYSTTNLPTEVRLDGHWVPVANPEMDCGLVVGRRRHRSGPCPMHRVRVGDRVVVGNQGVRVQAPEPARGACRPSSSWTRRCRRRSRRASSSSRSPSASAARAPPAASVLAVCGPAVIHTGGGPDVARLVRGGWIQVLFAGNGFATHDMESNVLGTSLGVSVAEGAPTEGGHSNHLRVINEVRRHGSIAAAVEAGFVTGGVMYECVQAGVPFVLGGSIRDDGPLPDTMTDVVAAADRMRELVGGVGVALMLATTLHAIATGNILPAGVETFCVDINQAVVTKLADRGSHQAHGIVTDVGLFVRQLADELDLTVLRRKVVALAAVSAQRSGSAEEAELVALGVLRGRRCSPSGPPSGRMTVAPRATSRANSASTSSALRSTCTRFFTTLRLGHQLEPVPGRADRPVHQHGRVVLDVVDPHPPEPLELRVVVRRDLVAVEHLGPEPGERRRVPAVEHDVMEAGHPGVFPMTPSPRGAGGGGDDRAGRHPRGTGARRARPRSGRPACAGR